MRYVDTEHCNRCGRYRGNWFDPCQCAQGIEAGTAETVEQGSVHESPVAKPCAQPEEPPQ